MRLGAIAHFFFSGAQQMGRFIINGGRQLSGTVEISGAKNAALPIIFASMTLCGVTTVKNLPNIGDVDVALSILTAFGARLDRMGDTVKIDTRELHYISPCDLNTEKLRASTYLIGAMLARFGRAELPSCGGCNFDARPIDMHISAAESFGASFDGEALVAPHLYGADIHFSKISVGATVNSLIMAASAEGVSHIYGYAKEPHVIALGAFLSGAGAEVTFSNDCITVVGGKLSSTEVTVISDMIEAGTYLLLGALSGSDITVKNADPSHLDSFFTALAKIGLTIEIFDTGITVSIDTPLDTADIITAPYPDFPTDLAPVTAPLVALSGGRITEGVWHNRFGYLSELSKLGVNYCLHDGYADIYKSRFAPAIAEALDLRGGAALLITALAANGESVVENSELIKRGYTDVVNKLSALGADIKEISD